MKNNIAARIANVLTPIGVVLGIVVSAAGKIWGVSDDACTGIFIVILAGSIAVSFLIARLFGLIDSGL